MQYINALVEHNLSFRSVVLHFHDACSKNGKNRFTLLCIVKFLRLKFLSIDLNQSYSVEHVQAVHRKAIANRLTPLNAPSVLAPTTLLWR
jgi:hypothetical protein